MTNNESVPRIRIWGDPNDDKTRLVVETIKGIPLQVEFVPVSESSTGLKYPRAQASIERASIA